MVAACCGHPRFRSPPASPVGPASPYPPAVTARVRFSRSGTHDTFHPGSPDPRTAADPPDAARDDRRRSSADRTAHHHPGRSTAVAGVASTPAAHASAASDTSAARRRWVARPHALGCASGSTHVARSSSTQGAGSSASQHAGVMTGPRPSSRRATPPASARTGTRWRSSASPLARLSGRSATRCAPGTLPRTSRSRTRPLRASP